MHSQIILNVSVSLKRQKKNSGSYRRTLLTLAHLGSRTHIFFLVYLKTPLREVFGELCTGTCAPGSCPFQCLGCVVSGPRWSQVTIKLLNSSKEPLAQLVLKKLLLDIYNLADCQTMPGLSLVVKYVQLFVVSEFAWCQIHTQIYKYCFFSLCQSGCGRMMSTLRSLIGKHPVCFLLGPSTIFSSLDFNVFFYKLQCWERTALVTLERKILLS